MTDTEFTKRLDATRKRLYLIALTITKNKEDAEDAVSNAVLRALKKYKKLDGSDNFDGYMVTLTANEAKRIRSGRRFYENVDELADAFQGEDSHENLEFFDMIESSGVGIKGRKILVLRFLYGYNLSECAKLLRVSESNVKAEYYRSLQKIRITVDKNEKNKL